VVLLLVEILFETKSVVFLACRHQRGLPASKRQSGFFMPSTILQQKTDELATALNDLREYMYRGDYNAAEQMIRTIEDFIRPMGWKLVPDPNRYFRIETPIGKLQKG
jgi:hypothetical protein